MESRKQNVLKIWSLQFECMPLWIIVGKCLEFFKETLKSRQEVRVVLSIITNSGHATQIFKWWSVLINVPPETSVLVVFKFSRYNKEM